jgi:uncharacterized damage-inducible protein DinB
MTLKPVRTLLAFALFSAAVVAPAAAQDGPNPKIAPGTIIEPSKTFDAMLTNFEKEFTGAAKAMPAEKYGFAPTPAVFAGTQKTDFKTVKTFAQEVTHVAEANYYYASIVGGLMMPAKSEMDALRTLTDKDQILAALAKSFEFSHKAFATLTEKNAFESIHEKDTRASLAGGLVAHGFDHYGQMVEYLRMNGIIPPASVK